MRVVPSGHVNDADAIFKFGHWVPGRARACQWEPSATRDPSRAAGRSRAVSVGGQTQVSRLVGSKARKEPATEVRVRRLIFDFGFMTAISRTNLRYWPPSLR
jgi:hypothetical protein